MAVRTRANYKSTKNTRFANNSTGNIGADDSQDMHEDTADSTVFWEDDVLDEDNMDTNSDLHVPTQQSVKAYVDSQVNGIISTSISVSSSDILALYSSPKILVAAPGAGNIIEIISARGKYTNGTAYTGLTDVGISLYSTTIERFLTNRFDFSTSPPGFPTYFQFEKDTRTWINSVTENIAICLKQNTANPTTGTGTMKIYLTYRIIAV